jgi:hypothetical protein
MSIFPRL